MYFYVSFLLTCSLISFINSASTFVSNKISESNSLVLVHTLFRHGDRTADHEESFPTDPLRTETYYPYGWGQLTNKGKNTSYNLGQFLRSRYDEFIGKFWMPGILDAQSTNYDRTKMSLQLVLAGLYPPETIQKWRNSIEWQPIPFMYSIAQQDKILTSRIACSKYKELFNEYIHSENHLRELKKYENTFSYLSENTGLNITHFHDAIKLYFGLTTIKDWSLELPEWTKSVYPEVMLELSEKAYQESIATNELKRIATGYFLKKLIDDTNSKINGSLIPREVKMFLYSGHEYNLAQLLIVLGVYEKHVPPYGSCIIIEVHVINGEYGFKWFYQDYSSKQLKKLKILGCDHFCPIKKFTSIVKEYLPTEHLCP